VSAKFRGGVAMRHLARERPHSKPGSSCETGARHMVIFNLVKVRRSWSTTFGKGTDRAATLSLVRSANLTIMFLPANVLYGSVLYYSSDTSHEH